MLFIDLKINCKLLSNKIFLLCTPSFNLIRAAIKKKQILSTFETNFTSKIYSNAQLVKDKPPNVFRTG